MKIFDGTCHNFVRRKMKSHIIIIGSELLNGKMSDTNSIFIAEELNKYGIEITGKSIVGDNRESIRSCISKFYDENDILILSGGLGPTIDDVTRDSVADFFACKLVFNNIEYEKICNKFAGYRLEIPERNKKQAYFPEGAVIMDNEAGSASPFYIEKVAVFPGIPAELMETFPKYLKILSKNHKLDQKLLIKDIIVWGIPESELEDKIWDIIENESEVTTEFLVKDYGIIIRLLTYESHKAKADLIKERIYERIRDNIIGEDNDRLEQLLFLELKKCNYSISVAESCTGGLLSSVLVSVPGISECFREGIVVYSNESKVSRLNVDPDTITKKGAVSHDTVKEMLDGLKTDTGIAISGIAGPEGGTAEKPVGTVYIGIKVKSKQLIKKFIFRGDRQKIRSKAALSAINELRKLLLKDFSKNKGD